MIAIIALVVAILALVGTFVNAYNDSVQNKFNKFALKMLESNRNRIKQLDPLYTKGPCPQCKGRIWFVGGSPEVFGCETCESNK